LLPPVRRLAIDLGVHINTVAYANRNLDEEGCLALKHHRRALVIARTAPRPIDPAVAASFARRLRELVAEVRAAGVTRPRILRELRLIAKGLES
ncbi:MAG: hypothetical protein ACK6D7_20055, partial [Acidobacteriota bacterium]